MNGVPRTQRAQVPSDAAVDLVDRSGVPATRQDPQALEPESAQRTERIAALSPPRDSSAGDARAPGVASKPARGTHPDESLQRPVVASPDEILLAEQLRLQIKKKYLDWTV